MKITINNHSMSYMERGLPQGVPIVFIHGFPFNHMMWDPQMKALPNHYRAITYDIRGHGESAVGDGQYSLEFFVDDLLGLLDHLERHPSVQPFPHERIPPPERKKGGPHLQDRPRWRVRQGS